MERRLLRVVAGSMLTLGLALGIAQSAGAQGTGTSLTVHQRLCGDNYKGGDPFVECHDVLVGQAFEFTIDGAVNQTKMTDAATGNVTFDSIPAGTYNLYGGIPGEFSNQEIYCSDSNTGKAIDVSDAVISVGVTVPDGAAVVCDVYEHPENLSGMTPTPAPSSTVISLPNTGAGESGSDSDALFLVIPAALAVGGLGLISKRRFVH